MAIALSYCVVEVLIETAPDFRDFVDIEWRGDQKVELPANAVTIFEPLRVTTVSRRRAVTGWQYDQILSHLEQKAATRNSSSLPESRESVPGRKLPPSPAEWGSPFEKAASQISFLSIRVRPIIEI